MNKLESHYITLVSMIPMPKDDAKILINKIDVV
jgi:hypothetical protein